MKLIISKIKFLIILVFLFALINNSFITDELESQNQEYLSDKIYQWGNFSFQIPEAWKYRLQYFQEDDQEPYLINGQGPQFQSQDPKLLEILQQGNYPRPPQPEMPLEEPKFLTQMQIIVQDLQQKCHNQGLSVFMNKVKCFQQLKNTFHGGFFPRFSELQNKDQNNLQFWRNDRRNRQWELITWRQVWANSVYTWRFLWWSKQYPAINAIQSESYWCSTGHHKENEEIIYQGLFDYQRRLNHLFVRWAYGPGLWSLQITPDGKKWETKIPWKKGNNGLQNAWWMKIFWWLQWKNSYSQKITLDYPQFCKGIRLLMKKPVGRYFGIYRIEAWTKQWTIQIKSASEGQTKEDCLALEKAQNKNGLNIVATDCLDCILQGDSREVWMLQTNFMLTSYKANKCLDAYGGRVDDYSKLIQWDCHNNNNQKWIFTNSGLIKSLKDMNRCITILSDQININEIKGLKSCASSTMSDGQHHSSLALDGKTSTFWASAPGYEEASYKLLFPPRAVKQVKIEWKFPAYSFDVLGFYQGFWRSYEYFQKNNGLSNSIDFGSNELAGIKIIMKKNHKTLGTFHGKPIFGISRIKLLTGTKKVGFRECKEENGGKNKWTVEEVDWNDFDKGPKLEEEKKILSQKSNILLDKINLLVKWPHLMGKIIEKCQNLKKRLSEIEDLLSNIDLGMNSFRENLEQNQQIKLISNIGNSPLSPGKSCQDIKRLYSYKKTGYYWIQTKCSPSPLRVYCDYKNFRNGVAYAYLGALGDHKDISALIKTREDVKYECAKLGLQALLIKSAEQVLSVQRYIIDIGVDTLDYSVIPLGYDYGCDQGHCSGRFHSLQDENSLDITDILNKLKNPLNFQSKQWAKLFNQRPDNAIGIGMSAQALTMPFKMPGQTPIKGIVCSTNIEDQEIDSQWITADCDTTVNGNPDFLGTLHTNFKVICPSGCLKMGERKVWGTFLYKDDSSICKAAIHMGIIQSDIGGGIEVGIERGQKFYKSSTYNGISTLEWAEPWQASIVVNKYQNKCPIDDFRKRASKDDVSFLQESSKIKISDESYLFQDYPQTISNSSNNYLNSIYFKAEPEKKSSNVTQKQDNKNGQSGDQKNGKNEQQKKEDGEEMGSYLQKIDSTEQAFNQIVASKSADKNNLLKNIRLVKDSKNLCQQLRQQIGSIVKTDLSPRFQNKYFEALIVHIRGTLLETKNMLKKGKQKFDTEVQKLAKKSLSIQNFLKYSDFTEDYSQYNLQKNWEIMTIKHSIGGEANYFIKHLNDNQHNKVIAQESNTHQQGIKLQFAGHLILKQKRYFDARFSFSFMARDDDQIGFAFRYMDPFNYYVLEISKSSNANLYCEKGYKIIRKIVNGKSTTLAKIEDGGFLQDKWYVVSILFQRGEIKVYMDFENSENYKAGNEYKIHEVLSTFDADLTAGTVAILVNGMQGVYYDYVRVNALDCFNPSQIISQKISEKDVFYPPMCSRFKENFRTTMDLTWKMYKNEQSVEQGKWAYQKPYLDKEVALTQNAFFDTGDSQKTPTILQFIKEKICDEGVIKAKFIANQNGYVGIGFHYINSENHYVVEVWGEKNQMVQIRKVTKGKYQKIASTEDYGYQLQKWTQIIIKIQNNQVQIYLGIGSMNPKLILKTNINYENKFGKIALMTYLTTAGFIDIEMMPNEDLNIKSSETHNDFIIPSIQKEKNQHSISQISNQEYQQSQQDEDIQFIKRKKENFNFGEEFVCLKLKNDNDRKKYCQSKFLNDELAFQDCKNNFCMRCCKNQINSLEPSKVHKCEKDCKILSNPPENNLWFQCIESPYPKKTAFQNCENNFHKINEISRCKTDWCQLCCVLSSQIFSMETQYSDTTIHKCKKECIQKFNEVNEIIKKTP